MKQSLYFEQLVFSIRIRPLHIFFNSIKFVLGSLLLAYIIVWLVG